MTTGKAWEFLGNSGTNLWHMTYDRYGLNYFVQGRMSRPYPRMRINQIRQPSQKIAIGDFRDSTSAAPPSATPVPGPGRSNGHAASFHGPETPSMGLFMLWTRRQKTFAYSDTQSADESDWWLR